MNSETVQQERNFNESLQDDLSETGATSTDYVHPYFQHDKNGNIAYVTDTHFDFQIVLGMPEFPKLMTNGPLTEDFVNEQIVIALNWLGLRNSGERLYYFLNSHFSDYGSNLLRDDSDQPFFVFLFHLVETTKHPLQKKVYNAVKSWIYEHQPENISELGGDPQTLNPLKLSYREIALMYIYLGLNIETRIIADTIVASYGGEKESSGKQLLEDYNKFQLKKNRIDLDGPKARKLIKNIEKVIPLLKGKHLERAEEEMNYLQDKI